MEIRSVAEQTNSDLLALVKQPTTKPTLELRPLLLTLIREMASHDIPTRMAALRWIYMLLEKVRDLALFVSRLAQGALGQGAIEPLLPLRIGLAGAAAAERAFSFLRGSEGKGRLV